MVSFLRKYTTLLSQRLIVEFCRRKTSIIIIINVVHEVQNKYKHKRKAKRKAKKNRKAKNMTVTTSLYAQIFYCSLAGTKINHLYSPTMVEQ